MAAAAAPRLSVVSIIEADPDLGAALNPLSRAQATRFAVARTISLPPGAWTPSPELLRDQGLGLLVLDGLVVRDVLLTETRCTELIAAGDVVDPRDTGAADRLLPLDLEWTVLEPVNAAVLDERFAATVSRWPGLTAALFERAAERAFRLATQVAICQLSRVELRLIALLWHFAERWGRVSPDGIVLPLRVSHAMLGRLVGARRPTITLALKELQARGAIVRRPEGLWQLPGHPPEELRQIAAPQSEPARGLRLVTTGPRETASPGRAARSTEDREVLRARVEALRELCRVQMADTEALAAETRNARAAGALRRSGSRSRGPGNRPARPLSPPRAPSAGSRR